jgi:Heparinase II/III N-terminus
MELRSYLRQLRDMPAGLIARKAIGFALRVVGRRFRSGRDRLAGSYGRGLVHDNQFAQIQIRPSDISPDLESTLGALGCNYMQHRFDLLSSGWAVPCYGFQPDGFLGHRYDNSASPVAPDRAGSGLEAVVNRSNLRRALEVWRLISREGYEPIDWQLDFRSGYRWSARHHSYVSTTPVDCGVDVKVPWELGRLQHLPQLALCAILAADGRTGFDPADRYIQEITDQLLDFIATNPPRFGVNWMCTMDVAIRAANIALTLALLEGAGLGLEQPKKEIVLRSLRDHARHIVSHLEYSERGRSNHYIANVAGLLWACWAMEGDAERDRGMAFAIAEVFNEVGVQFYGDGGNYEGSTGYHRLSTEMILFSIAIVCSLDDASIVVLDQATPPRKQWRATFPQLPFTRQRRAAGGAAIVPSSVLLTLRRAGTFSRAVQGADGTVVQIGDYDSGRFFKLHPIALSPSSPSGRVMDDFVENVLDHGGVADGIDVLFGNSSVGRRLDGIVVGRLTASTMLDDIPDSPVEVSDFGDLDALIARCQTCPEDSRRMRRLPLMPGVDPQSWTRAGFSDFGLYLFRHERGLLVAFRCYQAPPAHAPRGHLHDDNLGLEYRLGNMAKRDPGSYVYTPSISMRNRYRAAGAHDVPRARGKPIAEPTSELFHLNHRGFARCLAWRQNGVAGEISGAWGRVLRVVKFTPEAVIVWDCVDPPDVLEENNPDIALSRGYGRL